MPNAKYYPTNAKETKERQKKRKAAKVRFDLDSYHKELGGLFSKKVVFYCMPRKTGKTEKARNFFGNYHGPGESLFISVDETKGNGFNLSKEGPFELVIGRSVEPNKLVIAREFGRVIIDNVHLLSKQRIVKVLVEFLSGTMTTELLCFGTNTTDRGIPITGARHLEFVADEVIYDTSACHACMQIGKTSFTKLIYISRTYHSCDCLVTDKDGYYVERDLCFGCRLYDGKD